MEENVISVTATGEKAKARDIIAAIRTLKQVESEERPATFDEKRTMARFGGFGAVALKLFPDPVSGKYKDPVWQDLGDELRSLLTADEYDSAKRTTFNAFYTSPVVVKAMHAALADLGVAQDGTVLEPGCGTGNFLAQAPAGMRCVGVELDAISGRIARLKHPAHQIKIENFRDTKLPDGAFDAVIGNPPFADVRLEHRGIKMPLHDFFISKSLDAVRPGGILAVVTSHYTLDKLNAACRESLGERADFLGAVRLPSEAFEHEGTSVVTDIVFLRKRAPGEPVRHADPQWLETANLEIGGASLPINRYFLNHPEQVLGTFSRKDTLYGGPSFSVVGTADFESKLHQAIARLPKLAMLAEPLTNGKTTIATAAFEMPPLERNITEGSFYLDDSRRICQVEGGIGVPVVYGGTEMNANGTMGGKRLAHLIELRYAARRVLQSQNEGWPDGERDKVRRDLNRIYDRFVTAYGPINKTTFSETKEGSVIRRMPNLVKFREDPDAMIVMALEDYDEVTGKASKAPILLRDVVGQTPEVTQVRSAEEGLLVSLDRTGTVDPAWISNLYGKPAETVIEELGDLIYRDPVSNEWQTADAYLSGNVREKLAVARRSGAEFARNAEALERVQPEDVLPGDIDAALGAPWIPAADIQVFAAELFHVGPGSIKIGHLAKDALWSVEGDYQALASVAVTSEFGTPRIDGVRLLELALNMNAPVIYDVIRNGDREERIVNQDETLAAREKQRLIKDRFRSWVFADPDRTERLVRLYNDTYNNLRPRLFDGSHLEFPGMSRGIDLRPHQTDAVWRGMSSGNTLLAHAVGAGKTFTMAATGMKMKQAGLIRKPMYVVPNHMLEQFSREFMQLYPNAKLLVAAKEDLARDRRKLLTAKIAGGEWDGIVVTHSSFERIGMSKEFQERFLKDQIAEYDELLREHAGGKSPRNIIKTIEKQKARREERIKQLSAEEKKDDGLVFDELGVDHVFVDEAHYFKNLETPTKMERVAGIQTGGSERAYDLFMKARYLSERHPGHGVTFATGTPISNTMVELYTMQRFLDPKGLEARGIGHFDGWAATFGEVVDAMEISPDGASLRPRSRFARFTNLPELQQMFRSFADVKTAEMLDLPRPALEGGKPQVIACPMSAEQAQIQSELVARYERLRTQKVDPRVDNALAITTDGRKLALDARLISPDAEDTPGSKIEALVDNVAAIWRKSADSRGTQLIFSDIGVNPTAWGFSVYDDVIRKLTERGVPRDQIATIGEADSDAKKQALFDRVRNGSVRVLLGSTAKMGTGTNVQKRLVALHHLDAPWKPAEVEQREGRILRQGNGNAEIAIYRYVTEGSFDAYMWQALETKAKFIGQVMTGDNAARRADDIGGQELSYAEVKAIASGNPAVLTLAEADAELGRLAILRKNHADEQFLARRALRELPEKIERLEGRIASLTADREKARVHESDPVVIGSRPCPKDDLMERLGHALEALPKQVRQLTRVPLGRIRGLAFGVTLRPDSTAEAYLEGSVVRHAALSREHRGPRAILNALDRLIGTYGSQIEEAKQDLAIAQGQLRDHQARLGKTFPHQDYLTELTSLRDALKSALAQPAGSTEQPEIPVAELAERIKSLKAAHGVEATPDRNAVRRTVTGEEPVTRRIRKQRDDLAVEAENPVEETVLQVETKPIVANEPLQKVAEPERKSPDIGHLVIEPAEPVLEFRRVVESERTDSRPKTRSY